MAAAAGAVIPEEKDAIDFYAELVRSIPDSERSTVLSSLEDSDIVSKSARLRAQLDAGEIVGANLDESRLVFLSALRGLKHGEISANQLASLHILDSAIRTLYVNPVLYLTYRYVNAESELARTVITYASAAIKGLPTGLQRYRYNTVIIPKEGISLGDLALRFQKPPMKRFFNFNDTEWDRFCNDHHQQVLGQAKI